MSGCGEPIKFARRIAKVGRPTAQHSLSVCYALSLIEPPKATVAALVVAKRAAILPARPRPVAIRGGGTATAD